MEPSNDVTITLSQIEDGKRIQCEIWSPAFVDSGVFLSVEDAMVWALARTTDVDIFEPYEGD